MFAMIAESREAVSMPRKCSEVRAGRPKGLHGRCLVLLTHTFETKLL